MEHNRAVIRLHELFLHYNTLTYYHVVVRFYICMNTLRYTSCSTCIRNVHDSPGMVIKAVLSQTTTGSSTNTQSG